MFRKLIFLIFLIINISCTDKENQLNNLYAFSKIYGYVRWFYPGDEASNIDWNKFTIYGIKRVKNAKNNTELVKILEELFLPIAPGILFNPSGAEESWRKNLLPKDTSNIFPVFWIHNGVNLGENSNVYKSVRVNRDYNSKDCLKSLKIGIPDYNYEKIKLSYSHRISGMNDSISILFTFFNKSKKILEQRRTLLASTVWSHNELELSIPDKANQFCFEIAEKRMVDTLWFGDIKIAFKEKKQWNTKAIFNQDFSYDLAGWNSNNLLCSAEIDTNKFDTHKRYVKIYPRSNAKVGDYFQTEIDDCLSIALPLVIYADNEKTYPITDNCSFRRILNEIDYLQDSMLKIKNKEVRLANVIISWNVLQHFYPYFDAINVNWDAALKKSLEKVLSSNSEIDYYKILVSMITPLMDGHGYVLNNRIKRWFLNIKVIYINHKIVIIDSHDENLKKGDIILKVNGKKTQNEIEKQMNLFSGSPQFKHSYAIQYFGSDFKKDRVRLVVQRNGKKLTIKTKRVNKFTFTEKNDEKYNIGNEIYFLQENYKLNSKDIQQFTNADGVIIDGSKDRWNLLPHIIEKPVLGPIYCIPITTQPDRLNTCYKIERGIIFPREPFLDKPEFVFITHSYDASSSETFLQIINNYHLGTLVGERTAGVNGNINIIPLIDEYSIRFTGMKILNHDGSQFHLCGLDPKYRVTLTMESLEGINEYLEKAKEVIKKEIKSNKKTI